MLLYDRFTIALRYSVKLAFSQFARGPIKSVSSPRKLSLLDSVLLDWVYDLLAKRCCNVLAEYNRDLVFSLGICLLIIQSSVRRTWTYLARTTDPCGCSHIQKRRVGVSPLSCFDFTLTPVDPRSTIMFLLTSYHYFLDILMKIYLKWIFKRVF